MEKSHTLHFTPYPFAAIYYPRDDMMQQVRERERERENWVTREQEGLLKVKKRIQINDLLLKPF